MMTTMMVVVTTLWKNELGLENLAFLFTCYNKQKFGENQLKQENF